MTGKKGKDFNANGDAVPRSDEWLTPPEILLPLGQFDLDPAAPLYRPWDTAKRHYSLEDNGLIQPWAGRIWLNPPYSDDRWLALMAQHNHGTMLLFARTETIAFQEYVFKRADSLLFLASRLSFYTVAGTKSGMNAGAPSVLIAYGERDSLMLADSRLKGKHIPLQLKIVFVAVSPCWRKVVEIAITRLNGTAELYRLYDTVSILAPDKIRRNKHYKAKVRQVVQKYFKKVSRGRYRHHV